MSGSTSTGEAQWTLERRFPPQPASVGEARRLVRSLLADAGRDDLNDVSELMVSEVVTNALLHAGTEIELSAAVDEDGLRVEVGDGSMHLPVRRRYAPTAGTGRGLMLLEQLVDDWGVARHEAGKTVWFTLTSGDREPRMFLDWPAEIAVDSATSDAVMVDLLDLPLLLHAAWQEHAESMLRDFLLASLDDKGDTEAIQVHADATDAMAVLEEHVPRLDFDVEADRLMQAATEPRVSRRLVTVPIPVASVPSFVTLDRAIDAALEMARDGQMLTPPTQPEIQGFRRWLCRQVVQQAAGAPPEAWTVDPEPTAPDVRDLEWDARTVTEASTARIAADDANRIVAVSPAALELLGYDEPGQLVGRRLVSIIPERYRQAHVAGFTMFLVSGRRPLLGRRVSVPALRRDGAETPVQLLIEAVPTGDARTVFVADLTPDDRSH